MNKIVIIGGGFAGLSAAKQLCKKAANVQIILIDRRKESNFLPMLPDIIGRGVAPEFLVLDLELFSRKLGVQFINDSITAVNLEKRELYSAHGTYGYDYLIIASGSETNFYGNDYIKQFAYKLDDVEDAKGIVQGLKQDKFQRYIVVGAGYTGIELATNLRLYLDRHAKDREVIIVEQAGSLLGPLPEWMKNYVSLNLKRLKIDIELNCAVDKTEADKVFLTNQKAYDKAMLIWAAGVKVDSFVNTLAAGKTRQGRISVNEYLGIDKNCFVVADAANFICKDKPLRMAVQFSIAQGRAAADNLAYSLKGARLRKYKPVDLGYVIPMANNKSCGRVLGINVRGRLATILHYLMCIYRSHGLRNKMGILRCLIKGGAL